MPDLLALSARWLEDQRHQHCTTAVRYRRGAAVINVNATFGRTVFRDESAYGIVTHHVSRDFLIRVDDLVLGGLRVEPEAGDEVLEPGETLTRVHEVMSPTRDDPAWRYSDSARVTYRIHTKHTGQEPTP